MKTGSAVVMRWMSLVVLAALLPGVVPAVAQTPDDACAADSLFLISPDVLHLDLQTSAPGGMVISWPNLDLTQATCFSLADTAGLDFKVDVSGGFGDKVDRVFQFTTADSGVIGAVQSQPLGLSWKHQGPSNHGSFEGLLNLANNGGVWHFSANDNSWSQINKGLPMTWRQVNVVALGEGPDGTLLAGMTRGQAPDSDPVGLFINHGDAWSRIAADVFNTQTLITRIAVSPEDSDHFLVGTKRRGLFVTRDGGQNFTQLTTQLDPEADNQPTVFTVSTLAWLGDKIFLYVNNFGVFSSQDGGANFTRLDFTVPSNLDSSEPDPVLPVVNSFSFNSRNPNLILASLQFHGTYESEDGGASWHDLYGDLVKPDTTGTGAWVNSALDALVDPDDQNVIVMSVSQKGLYRTSDGGQTWVETGADVQPVNRAGLTLTKLVAVPSQPGLIYAQEDGYGLLMSDDFGETWTQFPDPPILNSGFQLMNSNSGAGDLVFGTYGGGVYVPGTALDLSATYTTGTSTDLRNLDLGLQISFSSGSLGPEDAFRLVCQTFQGWAVWRAPAHDPHNPVMLGLYDRVNPESCLEGYCGDSSVHVIPQCFAAKRAACFEIPGPADPDTIRFFDGDVYNGFGYYYSVTSFDYGNTALTTPANNTKTMLFSPRWTGDENSLYHGMGNQSYVQINLGAAPDTGGDEIYVYPNPLRPGVGIPGEEGRTVVFTNLPEGASIQVFTTAGDDVIELGAELRRGGQIYWNTENSDHQVVAPGVYLYKVTMPQRSPYWGRLVVIR